MTALRHKPPSGGSPLPLGFAVPACERSSQAQQTGGAGCTAPLSSGAGSAAQKEAAPIGAGEGRTFQQHRSLIVRPSPLPPSQRERGLIGLWATAATLLAGCALGPDYERPADTVVPDAYRFQADLFRRA